ncbi:MAG: hypothetical protein ACREX9_08185 [Gammaproteobacteria bacterium]
MTDGDKVWKIDLAPDIVVRILDETLPPDLTQFELAIDPPALWEEQLEHDASITN